MKKYIAVFALLIACQAAQAQGIINVEAQPKIDEMLQRYGEINRSRQFIDGWRIQLAATTDRQKVEREKQKFMQMYPDIPVDWTHVAPYYRLRAGAFLNKLEATQMLYRMKKDYSTAYPVKDNKIQPFEVIN